MSTDLAGVRILAIDRPARRVRLRVFIVYYDTSSGGHEPLPYDASFFCRALWRAALHEGTGGGLADTASVEQWCDEAWVNANAWRFVKRFDEVATRNHPVTDYSELSDFFYERQGRWVDEEKLVQGDYDVWFTEEKWLDGLVLGASFGSTAYCTPSDTGDFARAASFPEPQRKLASLPLLKPRGEEDSPSVLALALSDDSRWLAATSSDGRLALVDTTTWGPPRLVEFGENDMFSGAEFAAGEHRLLLGDGRSVMAATGEIVGTEQRTRTKLLRAGVRSGPVRVEVTEDDYTNRIRVLVGDDQPPLAFDVDTDFSQYVLDPSGRHLAYVDRKKCQLWDTATRSVVSEITLHALPSHLAFSPDGALLLFTFYGALDGGSFEVYDVASGQLVRDVCSTIAPREDPYAPSLSAPLERVVWGPGWVVFVTNRLGPRPECQVLGTDLCVLACAAPPPLPGNPTNSASTDDPPAIDAALTRRIASGGAPRTSLQIAEALAAHARFLAAAPPTDRDEYLGELYPDAFWEVLSAEGLPIAMWSEGEDEDEDEEEGADEGQGEDAVPDGAERATFRIANLERASLAGASLVHADFTGAYAPGIDLSKADLFGAAMTDAVFTGANLAGADLRAADLSRSDLRGADLRGANLESTDLERADLTGADLTGARIGGIKLRHAVVDGVRGFGEP